MANKPLTPATVRTLRILPVRRTYQIDELKGRGCEIEYNKRYRRFGLGSALRLPTTFHLIPLPEDWDYLDFGWAPSGFKPVGLKGLVSVGIEHPTVQEAMWITATDAYRNDRSAAFPVYAYLGTREGNRVIGEDGSGVPPFCLRGEHGYPPVAAVFEKL